MARLTYPIPEDQLIADVVINLDAATVIRSRAGGRPCPPITGKGLIDTGSNVSGVSAKLLRQLGADLVREDSTEGVEGEVAVSLFRVSLHLYDSRDVNIPWFPHSSLLIMELREDFPHDVLIGTDVLFGCVMTLGGPARHFTLDF